MKVTIIQPKGAAAVVEWVDREGIHRSIIPRSEIDSEGSVSDETLQAGVPYGAQWSEVELKPITGEMVEQALYRAGIWTFDDLQKNSAAAIGAIHSAYGAILSSLYQFAKSEVKDHGR